LGEAPPITCAGVAGVDARAGGCADMSAGAGGMVGISTSHRPYMAAGNGTGGSAAAVPPLTPTITPTQSMDAPIAPPSPPTSEPHIYTASIHTLSIAHPTPPTGSNTLSKVGTEQLRARCSVLSVWGLCKDSV
jgi:hypothetical protein